MNIKQLEYFVEVAKTLNYSKAAQNLYISQSAITKQIKLLEDELQTTLFYRDNKKVEITKAGELFLKEARLILRKVDESKQKIELFNQGMEGSLRIGYISGLERAFLIPVMASFYDLYPNVQVFLERNTSYILKQSLINKQYDLIFTKDMIDSYNNVLVRKYQLMLYASKKSEYSHLTSIRKEEIPYENVHNVRAEIDMRLLNVLNAHEIAILPEYATKGTLYNDYIIGIPIEEEYDSIYLVYDSNNFNPIINNFIDYITRSL